MNHNPNQPLIFKAVIQPGQTSVPFEQIEPKSEAIVQPILPVLETQPKKLGWWARAKRWVFEKWNKA